MRPTVIYFVFLVLGIFLPNFFIAQTNDFGTWNNIGVEKSFNKWVVEAEAELRTRDTIQNLNRWSLKLDVSYKIVKPLTLGYKYRFMFYNDLKYSDIQPRQRYAFYIQGKQKFGDFKFYLREQVQRTIKDERDRIRLNESHDTYKINPEWEWRNRLKVFYNIPKCRINPSSYIETYYQLNNPDGNTFSKLRFNLRLNYKYKKDHKFSLYGIMDKELNQNDKVTTYIIGLDYTYTFKKRKK